MRVLLALASMLLGQALPPPTRDVRVIHADTTQVGNVDTGEDTLKSISLGSDRFDSDAHGVRISIRGNTASNANAKTLRCYANATLLESHSLPNNTLAHWKLNVEIVRAGEGTQRAQSTLIHAGASSPVETTGADLSESYPLTFSCTCEATATDDCFATLFLVEQL